MTKAKAQELKYFSTLSLERIKISEEIFIILAINLNRMHNVSFSNRFWKILLSPYVSGVVNCRTILEDHNLSLEPEADVYLANTINPDKNALKYIKLSRFIKSIKAMGRHRKLLKNLRGNNQIGFGFHDKEYFLNKFDVYIEAIHVILKNKDIDANLRSINVEYSKNFSKIFVDNLIKTLPKVYVEYFTNLMDSIPLLQPEKKIFHTSMFESIYMRMITAKYIESGAKLIYYQHGGFYGECKYHNAHHYESSIADKFMTWGWKINSNDSPSGAFRLEKFKRGYDNHKARSIDILIIYPTIRLRNKFDIQEKSMLFFRGINREKYAVFHARPRPTAKFNRKSVLNFISKDVKKIDSGYSNLSNLISTSRLVIQMNYPSTNMLECFYVDHPVVGLLNNKNPSSVVKPFYDFLLDHGVLHNSMESLVDHLNNIDVELWWAKLVKEPMYLKFKNSFLKKVQ